jgi:Zn-dependent protease with chaperone function/tetratricopeptide (TPR) repeat protein
MCRIQRSVVALGLLLLSSAHPAAAQVRSADPEDVSIRADVERASPEAARLFEQANEARDRGDLASALVLYRQTSALIPSVDHPVRRTCSVLVALARFDEAVADCEHALTLGPDSAFNLGALTHALAQRRGPGDVRRALELGRRAASVRPDKFALIAWCEAAFAAEERAELRSCVDKLMALDPAGAESNVISTLAALVDGDADGARASLARARAAGIPDEQYKGLSDAIGHASEGGIAGIGEAGGEPSGPSMDFLQAPLLFVGAWVAVMLLLLLAGWILSLITLRAADRVAGSGQAGGDGTEQERALRRIYKAVVLLCGVYFYVSVPVLCIAIVVTGGGLIWMFFAVGYLPIKLILIVAAIVVLTLAAIVRGLLARGNQDDPGLPLELGENPRFRGLLDEVARAIGTRPVDSAYLTPHTEMAVTERGGLWKSIRGKSAERCLIMGVGLLDGMKEIELRSILGHEYGHFRNEDTAGGGFALAVRRSLFTMIVRLAQSGAATWYNPVWHFLRAYHRVYLVVSHGASRLQEVLADRWAVRAYGSQAFIAGFTHVVERSVLFDRHLQSTLHDAIDHKRALPNLYRPEPGPAGKGDDATAAATVDASDDPAELVRKEMEREPSAYDSHPPPRQRLARAAAMAVERAPEPGDDLPAWDLFADRDALERRMTARIREAVATNHGVKIAG